jgi:hypothetical protein
MLGGDVFTEGNMPTLKAPNRYFFFASRILAVVAWITLLAHIAWPTSPYSGRLDSLDDFIS